MEFEERGPARKAETLNDFTRIAAAMIEASARITDGASYQRAIVSVRESTGYRAIDISTMLMLLIDEEVLEHTTNINRRGSALTPLGQTIHQNMCDQLGLDGPS